MPKEPEVIRFSDNGVQLAGYIIRPSSQGPHSAVMVFPGAMGAGPSFHTCVRQLAALGYLAVAVDMYETSSSQTTVNQFSQLIAQPELLRNRAVGWFEVVCDLPDVDAKRVGAIGYCFGGRCVLELARSGVDVRCVSSFHGLLGTHAPACEGVVKAKVAIWTGGQDPYVPIKDFEDLQLEFSTANVEYSATLFSNAQHSFADPDHDGYSSGISYDATAHRIAWNGTLGMLEACLNPREIEASR